MKKILAIDDNEVNLELLHHIVKLYYPEFHFLKTTSGLSGIDIAKNELPEIILLDILMPEINGYEVCSILKNDSHTQNIPIIMISALGVDPAERTKGLNVGADSFVSKPFSRDEIRAQINVALRIKKVEDLLRKRNESLEIFIKDQTDNYLQNEERFLQISEHALEFYWEVDTAGVFTYVSPVVEKILHVSQNHIIGEKTFTELFQLENPTLPQQTIAATFIEKSACKDCEIELTTDNHNTIWLSVSSIPIINKTGDFLGSRGVCYDITQRKNSDIELKKRMVQIQDYQDKLKSLNKELTLVEERERRRIAENLHDGLGQTLSLAYIKLSSLVTEQLSSEQNEIIVETSELLNGAISESRNLTYDLSPPILYELGLIPAFIWKLQQIEAQHSIKTIIIGERRPIFVPKEHEIFLYRIVSELLTNVIKHAKASSVELIIDNDENDYLISVNDNGIGFKQELQSLHAMQKGGFGLLSITERLDGMNGRLIIESKNGTKATIAIPLN